MLATELARLHAAPGYRLILILDPSGVRVDALLDCWVQQQAHPVAWVRLEPADNELRSFVPHLRASLQSAGLFSTALALQDGNATWEDCLTAVLNAATEVPRNFFLILDGFHHLSSPDVHQAFGWMLDYIPDALHLLITSRQPLPLSVARLHMRRQVLEIKLG